MKPLALGAGSCGGIAKSGEPNILIIKLIILFMLTKIVKFRFGDLNFFPNPFLNEVKPFRIPYGRINKRQKAREKADR